MIYLVTGNTELFENDTYKVISVEESLDILNGCKLLQYDSETTGIDAHLDKLLSIQFGNDAKDIRIVVDCGTINILKYKDVLTNTPIIGHNLKFDLQFLYNYNIVPKMVWDTMIIEQLLYLGYPSFMKSYSLKSVAKEYLDIDIDKSIRGQIIWRGLDTKTIAYSAGDVTYLEKIQHLQFEECKKKQCLRGALLENAFTPVIAYMEWCGIKLDEAKWKAKMSLDNEELYKAKKALDDYMINYYLTHNQKTESSTRLEPVDDLSGDEEWGAMKKVVIPWVKKPMQLDMFNPDPSIKCTINWNSPEVIKVFKFFGFNTKVVDKQTGKNKDSIQEKVIKGQKGINDEFLKLYLTYQGAAKVVSTYGQSYLDAINPVTGRIHSVFRAIGASSSRMACGSDQPNASLAKAKHIPLKRAINGVQLQNLPADDITRSAFTAEKGNLLVDCDFSALESRLGADIYNEKEMIEEFLHRSGDMHSLCAKLVFHEELKDIPIKDIKKLRPDLRKKVKPIEFSQQFGGSEYAIASSLGCSIEEAKKFKEAYDKGFKGITEFKNKGSLFVRQHGYIVICKYTGHKIYWWDWDKWKKEQQEYTNEFWNQYREIKKNDPYAPIVLQVKEHFRAASKYDRLALNAPTQGTGCIILKDSAITMFNWVVSNGYFGKVKLCNLVHDEHLWEFPEELKDTFPKLLEQTMLNSAAKYCKAVPIPAEAEVSDHWVH